MAALLAVGLAMIALALTAPHIGLGTQESFVLYRWFGLSRGRITGLGALLIASVVAAAIVALIVR
ncbi:MAG: hypothetical protein ACT4N4_15140, partial [Rhodospirillales bacterium]